MNKSYLITSYQRVGEGAVQGKVVGQNIVCHTCVKCYRITSQSSTEVQLCSVFKRKIRCLHVRNAARVGYHAVVIHGEDTDFFIMSLALHEKTGASMLHKCGTKTRQCFVVVEISKVTATVGMGVCRALIGWQASIHWMCYCQYWKRKSKGTETPGGQPRYFLEVGSRVGAVPGFCG